MAEASSSSATTHYCTVDLGITLPGCELHEVSTSQLATWVARVVETEGPIHEDIVGRRIALAVGVTRKGSRIQSAMSAAITYVLRGGEIKRRGKFLHYLGGSLQVRDRSRLDSAERGVEHICPEEIELAIQETLKVTHGVEAQEVETLVARQFGISRAGKDVRTVLSSQVKRLRRSCRIIERQGFLEWVDSPDPV
ncbi:MAG: DUF3320 domain-containing protein [Acidobacteria bacterium]|nr:DUF3320 domain-containing protein [Acidobacteriota bacterium]